MRNITSPEYLAELWNMVSWTGKGINELGNYDKCDTEELDYVILSVGDKSTGNAIVRLGICSPKHCNSDYYYSGITNMIYTALKNIPAFELMDLEVTMQNPAVIDSGELIVGTWIVISIIILAALLWVTGIVVQYTNIGNKRYILNGENEPENIEDKKTRLTLFFYSWSPIVNFKKLVTVKQGGDQRLSVLNGVRVLSIGWVIVGHGFGFAALGAVKNIGTFSLLMNDKTFAIIPGGYYAVDSFFFLSGFLTFYIMTSKLYSKGGFLGPIKTFLIYFHRYYRLIFPLAFVTLVVMYLMPYIGSGPYYR
jgi:hypothetical protein